MPDWGIYSALRGQDDWAQKRQDAQMDMQILQRQEQEQELQIQQQAQMEAGINEYFTQFQNLDVLPEDAERVNQVERDARRNVISGIAKYNGDLRKFMLSGGNTMLNNYRQAIAGSDEVRSAMRNKLNLANYMADHKNGDALARPVGITYMDENGQEQQAIVTMDEQMELFRQGKIKDINYAGSVKRQRIDPNLFFKNVKDPNNPYQSYVVSQADVYNMAKTHYGLEDWHAQQLAQDYGKMYESTGNHWNWGAKDPYELQLKQISTLQRAAARSGGSKSASSSRTIQDYWNNVRTGKYLTKFRADKKDEWVNPDGSVGAEGTYYGLDLYDKRMVGESLGVDLGSDGNVSEGQQLNTTVVKNPRTGTDLDLGTAQYQVLDLIPQMHMINNTPYVPAIISMREDVAEELGIESTAGLDHVAGEWDGLAETVDMDGTNDAYKVRTLVPIPDSEHFSDFYNKKKFAQWTQGTPVVPGPAGNIEQSVQNTANVLSNF